MNTELQLREILTAAAEGAPDPDSLLDGALEKVRHRRTRVAWASTGCVALVAAILIVPNALGSSAATTPVALPTASGAQSGKPTESPPTSVGTVPSGQAGQPLPDSGSAKCAYAYSLAQVAARDFAFDGTVVAVGPARSNRGGASNTLDLVGVTLRVNQWFKGGTTTSVVVDMFAPSTATAFVEDNTTPTYGVGTRLLVSGAARRGGHDPLGSAISWPCGFTRYYSPSDAAAWARVTR